MDKVTSYEWTGNGLLLAILFIVGITIPIAFVYFITHLLKIEKQVKDGTHLADFLRSVK